jgi:AcrR family transcriptional regulator
MADGDETRDTIVEAATALFYEKGYRSTTTRAIAERAGVNEVTIFRHFGTKEKLLHAVVWNGIDVREELGRVDLEPSDDLEADLLFIATMINERTRERGHILKITLMEVGQHPEFWSHVEGTPRMIIGVLTGYFRKAMDRGLIRKLDPKVVSVTFFSFFFRSMLMRAFLGKDMLLKMTDREIREFVRLFVRGIRKEGQTDVSD